MTTRIHSLLVVLEADQREDDVDGLARAIGHMRGVAGVEKCASDVGSIMAEIRADQKWRHRLIDLLRQNEPQPPRGSDQ